MATELPCEVLDRPLGAMLGQYLAQGHSDMWLGIERPPLWLVDNPFYLLRHSGHPLVDMDGNCPLRDVLNYLYDVWLSNLFDFDTGDCGL